MHLRNKHRLKISCQQKYCKGEIGSERVFLSTICSTFCYDLFFLWPTKLLLYFECIVYFIIVEMKTILWCLAVTVYLSMVNGKNVYIHCHGMYLYKNYFQLPELSFIMKFFTKGNQIFLALTE